MTPAILVLADGTSFTGEALGAPGTTIGEAVFNTSMSGYQEILTDPSYRGQLVTMTSPHIGNYGINPHDMESDAAQVAGLIVREASRVASNWRSTSTLDAWLREQGTVAITGVDTRALTRHLRDNGAQMGAIVHGATRADVPAIVAQIAAAEPYGAVDWVARVSSRSPHRVFLRPTGDVFAPWRVELMPASTPWDAEQLALPEVAVVDFGVKHSILRYLALSGLRVTVWPHNVDEATLLNSRPAGVLLSNGPGDPALMNDAVALVQTIAGRLPIFGICLGHQIIGRALGGSTFKLKFGHRGPNQPVMDVAAARVQITSQNHGYAVEIEPGSGVVISHRNLNDGTCEGLLSVDQRIMSVQHHPEAGPGPHDALGEFATFREWIVANAG
jgi:carbamoyl-phosphate synthase small subunit